jgi:hypothetical protein
LQNGCYYDQDGKPILRVRGFEGFILAPHAPRGPSAYTPVHRVYLRPRLAGDGAYVDVFPSFYLGGMDTDRAATSSQWSRFRIDLRTTPLSIMVPMEAWGSEPIHLGRPC